MSEDPDLERRLEAMFASARPRHGFEDDLWRRIEARRPWNQGLGFPLHPALPHPPALAPPRFGNQKALAPAFRVLPPLAPGGSRPATAPQASSGGADTIAGGGFSG